MRPELSSPPRLPFEHPRWLAPATVALAAIAVVTLAADALVALDALAGTSGRRIHATSWAALAVFVVVLTTASRALRAPSVRGAVARCVAGAAGMVALHYALDAGAWQPPSEGLGALGWAGLLAPWLAVGGLLGVAMAPVVGVATRARCAPSHDGGDRTLGAVGAWLVGVAAVAAGVGDSWSWRGVAIGCLLLGAGALAAGLARQQGRLAWLRRVYDDKLDDWWIAARESSIAAVALPAVYHVPRKVALDGVLRHEPTRATLPFRWGTLAGVAVGGLPLDAEQVDRARERVERRATLAVLAVLAVLAILCARYDAPPRVEPIVTRRPVTRVVPEPVPVPPAPRPLAGTAQLALGSTFSCARMDDGTVRCWGSLPGISGWSEARISSVPTVVPGLRDVVEIGAAEGHVCARRADRTVWCWGHVRLNHWRYGRDLYQSIDLSTPHHVASLDGATRITVGADGVCALDDARGLRCWGRTTRRTRTPRVVRDFTFDRGDAVVTFTDGTVLYWTPDMVGDTWAPTGWRGLLRPETTPPAFRDAIEVVKSACLTCLRRRDGRIHCWISSPTEWRLDTPALRAFGRERSSSDENSMAITGTTLCALGGGRSVHCWDLSRRHRPAAVMEEATRELGGAVEIAVGAQHYCVRLAEGRVRCWGANGDGQLGDGTTTDRATPTTVLE